MPKELGNTESVLTDSCACEKKKKHFLMIYSSTSILLMGKWKLL